MSRCWTVWEIPLTGAGGQLQPSGVAWPRLVEIGPSGSHQLGPRGPQAAPRRLVPGGRAGGLTAGPQISVWTTAAPPPLLPRLRAAPRHRVELTAAYSPTALGLPEANLVGGGARLLRQVGDGAQRLWLEGSAAGGTGGAAELRALQLGAGHAVDLWTSGPLNLVWDSGIGVQHVTLTTEDLEQVTGGPRLLLGPRALLWMDGPGLVAGIGARARPGLMRVERDQADGSVQAGWALDAADFGAELSLGKRF